MLPPAEREMDLDLVAERMEAHRARIGPAVETREADRGGAGGVDDVGTCHEGGGAGAIEIARGPLLVGDGLSRRCHRGLAGTLVPHVVEDPVLRVPQAHQDGRSETEQQDREDEGLTPLIPHGVHSITRAARPTTAISGRPTKPRGTGTV